MPLRNTSQTYGSLARLLHWLVALVVAGMFGLGLWMRSLDYYHPWYQPAPALHISIGLLLIAGVALRLVWKALNPAPNPVGTDRLQNAVAGIVHFAIYAVLITLVTTGYLYATAEGRPADIFGLVNVPAVPGAKSLKGTIGWVHEYLAYTLIALASVHALGALKHHFIDRDDTLRRMWSGRRTPVADARSAQPKETLQ